jgi:hypothetical protein
MNYNFDFERIWEDKRRMRERLAAAPMNVVSSSRLLLPSQSVHEKTHEPFRLFTFVFPRLWPLMEELNLTLAA